MANKNYESMSLTEWVVAHPSEEDRRAVFLNLDRALKYIHDHGYCIQVFHPSEIEVLNNDDDYIQFLHLMELSSDPMTRKKMIKEDIFNSSLVQIGIYSKSLKYLRPDFLKENFDSFVEFLPQGDVPYYRGVIQRGASVYFCEYALEKRNRDLDELEKELGEMTEEVEKQYVKNDISITNDAVNDIIYKQINGLRDSAFINWLLVPTVILSMLVLFGILSWVATLLS